MVVQVFRVFVGDFKTAQVIFFGIIMRKITIIPWLNNQDFPMESNAGTFFFPREIHQAAKGVNLGGWLLLEPGPSFPLFTHHLHKDKSQAGLEMRETLVC